MTINSRDRRSGAAAKRPNAVDLFVAAIAAVIIVGLALTVMVTRRSNDTSVGSGGPESPGLTVVPADRGDLDPVGYRDAVPATGRVVEVDLVAAVSQTSVIDGGDTEVWAYNGTVPGPEIRIELGDTVRVELRNELPEPTSIHWHGVRVPNPMDGVPGMTQEPTPPGQTFVYEFTPPDAGTYWYHSHQRGNEQLERGLYGAIIVEDPTDPPYSQDLVWLVDDWLLDDDGVLDTDFDSSFDLHHSGRWGNVRTVNGVFGGAVEVAPGERLRLRVVNSSTARIIAPRFDDDALDALVVGVDGLPVHEPLPLDGFELAPGNRIDIDLSVPDDGRRRIGFTDVFEGIDPYPLVSLDIVGDPVDPPAFEPPSAPVPDWSEAADWIPDEIIELSLITEGMMMGGAMGPRAEPEALAGDDGELFRWALNGLSWPDGATHSALRGRPDKIRFVNDSGAFHPMHLHGQFFQVVARNGVPVREGYFRDTVLLSYRESVDVVVMPLDVGSWALHCHIQLHGEYGMMMRYDVVPP